MARPMHYNKRDPFGGIALPTKKKPDNRTRTQKIRAEQQEAIRAKFKGIEYVRQLEELSKEYDKLVGETFRVIKARASAEGKAELILFSAQLDILKFRLDTYKAKADLNFRRLKFVLPELKAIELTDPNGENPFASMAELLKEVLTEKDDEADD